MYFNYKTYKGLFNLIKQMKRTSIPSLTLPDEARQLKNDQKTLLSRVLASLVLLLIAINGIVLLFYFMSLKRIVSLDQHNFTTTIKNNIEETTKKHERTSTAAKEIIKNQHDAMREMLDQLEFDSHQLEGLNADQIKLKKLDDLGEALTKYKENPSYTTWNYVIKVLGDVETEFNSTKRYIKPIEEFNTYNDHMENNLKSILKEIKGNLDNFLNELLNLANEQNQNQKKLYNKMQGLLNKFNSIYYSMVRDDKFVKLNNFYRAKFIQFDRSYVPFSVEFQDKHFGSKLTVNSKFKLAIPRIYFCNLQAFIFSDDQFDIQFQYVDVNGQKEKVLFESKSIKGGQKNPNNFNEYFTFALPIDNHNVYLRIVSLVSYSRVHISKPKLECLSYRNFVRPLN